MPYLSVCVYTIHYTIHIYLFLRCFWAQIPRPTLKGHCLGIADDLALKEVVQMLHHQFSKKIPNLGPSGGSIALL